MTENAYPAGYNPPPGQAPHFLPPPPPPYTVSAALNWAWFTFRQHWKVFVVGMLIPTLISLVYYVVFLVIYLPVSTDLSRGSISDDDFIEFLKQMAVLHGFYFAASIPMVFLYANLMRAALVAADRGTPTLGMLVSFTHLGRVLWTSLILTAGILLGTLLCFVPGIALGVFSTFTLFFVVDQDLSGIAAVKASVRLVRAHLGLVVTTLLATGAIIYAGSAALIVGMAVSMPVGLLTLAYAYRSLVPATRP